MNIPDEFGLFPFQRFTADELRHFFVWCAAHKVSDVDLTGGSRAILRDEFEQTLSSADGTHLWKLPVTPLLTFSVNGQSVHVTPELE